MKNWSKRISKASIIPLTVAGLLFQGFVPVAPTFYSPMRVAVAAESSSLQDAFASAAEEFGVPETILLAVSYNLTRWEHHDGKPSFSAGYGVMHLTELSGHDKNHGKGSENKEKEADDFDDPSLHTLKEAAHLLDLDPDELIEDPAENVRGGAALLVEYARETTGKLPEDEADWYGAVAKYSGSRQSVNATDFADQVYETINEGAERETSDGQHLRLVATQVEPNRDTVDSLNLIRTKKSDAECPRDLDCRWIPARYEQSGDDLEDYGNYDIADRPQAGPDIRYIVIHDTETSYQGAIDWFQNPASYVAAHYVIRSSDGQITQMVKNKDVGWHAGNWYFNMHSIGIEHEGYMVEGASWYTEKMYRSSAKLVKYLANQYDIPLDRAHIIGHEEIPGLTPERQKSMHEDPGAFWDWEHYMELLGKSISPDRRAKQIVTIKPRFKTNKPELDALPSQSANFLYLYQEPSFDAPLFDDPLYPGPGSTSIYEEGSKVPTGQSYVLADHKGQWDAIWFGGQKAWFYNPAGKNTLKVNGMMITPKKGKEFVSVYGAAYPEESAYPSDIPPRKVAELYQIPQGQKYVAIEKVKGNYYSATTYSDDPYDNDHRMVIGDEEYYHIFFNHRHGFVKASDVDVVTK